MPLTVVSTIETRITSLRMRLSKLVGMRLLGKRYKELTTLGVRINLIEMLHENIHSSWSGWKCCFPIIQFLRSTAKYDLHWQPQKCGKT